jgi:hypothetical protein
VAQHNFDRLPKLSLWQISEHISDLILISEGSIEWLKVPKLRFVTHLMFVVPLMLFFVWASVGTFLDDYLAVSAMGTLIVRIYELVLAIGILSLFGAQAYLYYQYLLRGDST